MPSFSAIIGYCLMGLALLGGVLGTYHNIANASGPRERAFAIKMSAVVWLLVASMLAAITLIPGHLRYYVLGGYFVICPILLYKWSNTHQMIRMLDQRDRDEKGKA